MNAEVKECRPCKDTPASRFQDATYGKQQRVHNPTKSKDNTQRYRCTICGEVRT